VGCNFSEEQITLIIFGGFIFVMMGMYFANTHLNQKSKINMTYTEELL
jgi:hypothetical protein